MTLVLEPAWCTHQLHDTPDEAFGWHFGVVGSIELTEGRTLIVDLVARQDGTGATTASIAQRPAGADTPMEVASFTLAELEAFGRMLVRAATTAAGV